MCDYSLEHRASRPAVVGDKLIVSSFGSGTQGFSSREDNAATPAVLTAVCLLPGTELAFDAPVKVVAHYAPSTDGDVYNNTFVGDRTVEHKVARFAKINPKERFRHHDGLEFPDEVGEKPVLLTHLECGQTATVIQMPADIDAAKAIDAARAKAPEPV